MSIKLLLTLLVFATIFAYLSSLTNPFIWDDEQLIQGNVYVQTFDVQKIFTTSATRGAGVNSNYYRPVTSLSFAIDARLWGANVLGFHIVNLLLHIASGILLFFLLRIIKMNKFTSFAIALIFQIHPIQTEAVTYISSRGDSLYAFFLFLSLLLFALALQKKRAFWLCFGSVFTFLLSIFSKETVIASFPLYFALIYFFFLKTKKISKSTLFTASAITTSAFGYFLLRITRLNFENTLNFYGSQNVYTQSISLRLFTFAKVLWIYIWLLLFPYPLHMERTVSFVTSGFSPWVIGAVVLIIVLLALSIFEIRRRRECYLLLGFIFAASFLIPVSGIIPVNGLLYEHWLYMPLIGFLIILLRLGQLFFEYFSSLRYSSKIFLYPLGLLSFIYIILTIHQNNIWSDKVAFYTYTLQFAPWSGRVHNNLGMAYEEQNKIVLAVQEYKKAASLEPWSPQVYNNLGGALDREGDFSASERMFLHSLKLSPQFAQAQVNLLSLYMQTKQYMKALPLFKELLPYYRNNSTFLYDYGVVLWTLDKKGDANTFFNQALVLSNYSEVIIGAINKLKTGQ